MEQRVRVERSRDRKENAHGDWPAYRGADAQRRRTRHVGTLDATTNDGAGIGTTCPNRARVRGWADEHTRSARAAIDQADRRQVAESVCGRSARRIAG